MLAFAETHLPLVEIATGPSDQLYGSEADRCLGFLVQEMAQKDVFSSLLVAAALRSPVVSNRNFAIRALEKHPKKEWSEPLREALARAVKEEPDPKVRGRLLALGLKKPFGTARDLQNLVRLRHDRPRPKERFFRPADQIQPPGPDSPAILNQGCFATDLITVEGRKVGYMYREEPIDDIDSGWRFMAGRESAEYMADVDHLGTFDVNTILSQCPHRLGLPEGPALGEVWRGRTGSGKVGVVSRHRRC